MDEYEVLGGYVPSFVQHLKDTAARLGLGIGSRISAGGTVGDAADADVSSTWTPAEHDAFFRAVSVHSRWRPDLIAACVPTKTEWEVWMYLEALEEGAVALAMQRDGEDVDMVGGSGDERRDAEMQVDRSFDDSDSDSDADADEGICEPALEVSQAWIDAEERMAAWIVEEEHLACVDIEDDGGASDTEEVEDMPRKRKRGRPRGTGRGRAQSRAKQGRHSSPRAQDRSPSSEPSLTSTRKRSREPSTLPAQRREALMGHLALPHLQVLDSILREGEKEKSHSREGSVTAVTPTEYGDEGECHVHDAGVPPSDPHGTSNVSEPQSNVAIDPVLLAMSGSVDPAERAPTQGSTPGPSSLNQAPSQLTLLQVPLQQEATDTFTFPMTRAKPYPTANIEPDASLFSPRTRRRIQKRLYMRRKRALLRENSTGPEGVIDTGIEKLRPGKKAKSETPAVSTTSVACSKEPSDAEGEATENARKKNKAGLTLPYKLKAQFSELGIDAAYLVREGMDLLNLGTLGKLMGLHSSLEHEEEEEEESAIVQSIDAQLIRQLQAAMVSFVADIVHRAIVWREREIRLKQRCQAWRQSDHITIAAIEHAVDAVGARYHSHKEYFKSLVPANANEAQDPDVKSPELSPHRDVYTPLVRPPSGSRMACLSRTYEREATRTRRGPSADLDDEVMSDETNESVLEAELDEEDEAEVMDMALAKREEEWLWSSVKIKD